MVVLKEKICLLVALKQFPSLTNWELELPQEDMCILRDVANL